MTGIGSINTEKVESSKVLSMTHCQLNYEASAIRLSQAKKHLGIMHDSLVGKD